MNLTQGGRLHRRPLQGTWIRALHPRYLANPLGTAHTTTHASRFNPGTPADPAFEMLYLAEDASVALFEVQALLGSAYPGAAFVANPAGGPWTLMDVEVNLQALVDFSQLASRRRMRTSVQELTGDWRGYALRRPAQLRGGRHGSDVPTQRLGRRLERIRGLEGFLSYSARVASRRILMVFPRKLLPGSQLRYRDPATGSWHTLP
ncbi:MAG: RES family NAD+ phosphorylase [Gemmataceae bacterium]